ncbi:YesU family protein, partial [Escherichia coli]|nr:YesU family protein [Escherichia coli]
MEGGGQISSDDHSLPLSHVQDEEHFVFWCPETFPDGIIVTWDFSPIEQPGLCMLFFAAAGIRGEDLFDPSLRKRTGTYPEYHS